MSNVLKYNQFVLWEYGYRNENKIVAIIVYEANRFMSSGMSTHSALYLSSIFKYLYPTYRHANALFRWGSQHVIAWSIISFVPRNKHTLVLTVEYGHIEVINWNKNKCILKHFIHDLPRTLYLLTSIIYIGIPCNRLI